MEGGRKGERKPGKVPEKLTCLLGARVRMEIWNLEDYLVYPSVSISYNYFPFFRSLVFFKLLQSCKDSFFISISQCLVLAHAKYISPFYLLQAEALTPLCDFTSNSKLHISKINHCNYLFSWIETEGLKANLICTFSPVEWHFENWLLRTLNFDSVFPDPLTGRDN